MSNRRKNRKPTDEEVLAAASKWGNRAMTYVVRNVLVMEGFSVETPWVRRQMKRLEREGKVMRVSTSYATQLCWSVILDPPTSPNPERNKHV